MWSLVSNMLPLYVRIYVGLSTSSPHRSIPTNLSSILRDLDLIELMIVFNGFQQLEARCLIPASGHLCIDSSGKKKQKPTTSAAEAEISISRLDNCVGLITKAEKHPDADSLYVEDIDAGEGQTRTVVSGLVKYIPQEKKCRTGNNVYFAI
ncbi:unnamed protein product [Malus baccata var. baccata]